jgi:DNA repair exonuclease SbcCD ATPase subunit
MYALGLLANAKRHANKQSDLPMQVTLELDTNLGPVIIKRGAVTNISVNGVITEGSINKVNETIEQVFGMPLELIEPLIMRYQRKPGFFLSMTDSEKKEFLSKLLGLGQLETAIETAQSEIIQAQSGKELYEKLKAATVAVKPAEPKLAQPVKVAKDFQALDLEQDQALRDFSLTKDVLYGLERTLSQIELIEHPVPAYPPPPDLGEEYSNLDLIKSLESSLARDKSSVDLAIKEKQRLLETIRWKKTANNNNIDQYELVKEKLDRLQLKKTCYACNTVMDDDKVLALQTQYQLELDNLKVDLVQPDFFNKAIVDLENEIKVLASQPYAQIPQIAAAKEKQREIESNRAKALANWNAIKSKIESDYLQIKNEHFKKIANQKDQIRKVKTDIDRLGIIIKQIDQTRDLWVAQNEAVERSNKVLMDNHAQQLVAYNKTLDAIKHYDYNLGLYDTQIDTETDFITFIKAYLGGIFQELLDEIATTANSYLAQLSNANTFTVQFGTVKTTQSGVVKNEIRPIILKSGVVFDRENLSGGQLTSLELAVDLSLARVIRHRVGAGPAWIILDEAFDGHDSAVKEGCLELLTVAAQDAIVLVVDHALEFNEWFAQQICVECIGDVSRIMNANTLA